MISIRNQAKPDRFDDIQELIIKTWSLDFLLFASTTSNDFTSNVQN